MCGTTGTAAGGSCGAMGAQAMTSNPTAGATALPARGTHAHAGAAGAATTDAMAGMDMVGAGAVNSSHAGGAVTQMAGHGDMKMEVARSAPNDVARAQSVMNAAMSMFSNITYAQTQPGGTNKSGHATHRRIPDALKAQWKARYPGLPVPNMVVFDKAGGRPVGLLFISPQGPDLGMGPMHQHMPGKPFMAHMWFVPGNLDLAFSDVTRKAEATAAAAGR